MGYIRWDDNDIGEEIVDRDKSYSCGKVWHRPGEYNGITIAKIIYVIYLKSVVHRIERFAKVGEYVP